MAKVMVKSPSSINNLSVLVQTDGGRGLRPGTDLEFLELEKEVKHELPASLQAFKNVLMLGNQLQPTLVRAEQFYAL